MAIVFGPDILAASCAVGRRNSKYTGLDSNKLDAIKGMNPSM